MRKGWADCENELKLISEDAAYAGLLGALTGGILESGNIVGDALKPPESLNTILDASDDPIAEMTRRAAEIAKTSPIAIPETATITPEVKKNGYYQMPYTWTAEDGFEYTSRCIQGHPVRPKGKVIHGLLNEKSQVLATGKTDVIRFINSLSEESGYPKKHGEKLVMHAD